MQVSSLYVKTIGELRAFFADLGSRRAGDSHGLTATETPFGVIILVKISA